MNIFEQKLEQKNCTDAEFLAALDALETWDPSVEEHERRTEFCAVDCPGCKQRELYRVLECEYEDED